MCCATPVQAAQHLENIMSDLLYGIQLLCTWETEQICACKQKIQRTCGAGQMLPERLDLPSECSRNWKHMCSGTGLSKTYRKCLLYCRQTATVQCMHSNISWKSHLTTSDIAAQDVVTDAPVGFLCYQKFWVNDLRRYLHKVFIQKEENLEMW